MYLLYDSECCFCEGFASWVKQNDRKSVIEIVPFQDQAKVKEVASTLDPDQLTRSFHLAFSDGRILSGPQAIPMLAELTLPGGVILKKILTRMPGSERLLRIIYRWVSEHRWGKEA
ncbi:MAG: DUF393 domain-containing protein [Elusimicrobia bacterium]|nr:DUF393 domain-containing protein [Elusimicrobiota bacterium]